MKVKKSLRVIISIIAATLVLAFAFYCFACTPNEPDPSQDEEPSITTPTDPSEPTEPDKTDAWAKNFDLPNADEALNKLNKLYGGAENVFLLQSGRIARMPCPQGETITLNMTYEVGACTKLVIEDSVAEFNEVFSVINPNYKFAVNYEPTESDLSRKYSVRMSASENLAVTETSQVFGLAHISYYTGASGLELGDFGITIKKEVLDNGSYLMTTFKHELMHLLGAGDAYNNANATKATVMQSYTVSGYHFLSQTDIAFLDTLYRNPELNANDEQILAYIDAYEQTTSHTRAHLTSAVYGKLVDDLYPAAVISQAKQIGYKDISDFCATIAGGVIRDADFGQAYASFSEIEYVERPEKTYFGSIDPQTGKYSHGEQKTSLGSSQSIDYIDYGGGILYAAPNGNLYTIMIKTGDYYLAFRLSGGFTNFDALALDLWHISR